VSGGKDPTTPERPVNVPAGDLSSSRAVVRSGFFSLFGFFGSAAYMFLIVPVALGYLGQEQYGLWTTIAAVSAYIGLADFGVSTSFVTYIARFVTTRDYVQASRVVHLGLLFYALVSLLLIGITMLVYPLGFALLRIPAEQMTLGRDALLFILLTFAMASIGSVLSNALAAVQRMDVVNATVTGALVVKFFAIIAALESGWGLRGLLGADLAVTVATIPVTILLTKRHMPYLSLRWRGYDHALMRALVRFGAQMQVSRLSDMVLANFDKLLLARLSGLSVVATYDFGAKPAGRLRQLPAAAISSLVAAVSALDAQANEERIRAALVRSTRYLAIFSAPMFGFCMVFAEPLIRMWLGQGQEAAAMTLRVLSTAFFVSAVVSGLSMIAVGRGEPQFQMRAMLAQTVVNIVLSTTLVFMFGYFGAVAGTTAATLFGALLFFHMAGRRVVEHPLRLLTSITARPVVCALAAGGVSWLAFAGLGQMTGPWGRWMLAGGLAASGMLFLAVYALLLVLSRTLTADDAGFLRGVLPHRVSALLVRRA
jgi:O-antigen/teichoic acid export membrane protein